MGLAGGGLDVGCVRCGQPSRASTAGKRAERPEGDGLDGPDGGASAERGRERKRERRTVVDAFVAYRSQVAQGQAADVERRWTVRGNEGEEDKPSQRFVEFRSAEEAVIEGFRAGRRTGARQLQHGASSRY